LILCLSARDDDGFKVPFNCVIPNRRIAAVRNLLYSRDDMLSPSTKLRMIVFGFVLLFTSCSARDYLTRRLAADLISSSEPFTTPQQYVLQTGVVSNKDYASPEFLILQHHGWVSAATAPCPAGLTPSPCWDILLTPSGVDTIRALIPADQADKETFAIPVARRELLSVTGMAKQGNAADVEFVWRWNPLNEIGAALYSSEVHSRSTVAFRAYDDGWRLMQDNSRSGQSLDDALRNAEPAP
jgi:hypothetical protein